MITVYGAWPTRSFRVIWVLEELGLEYRIRPVDLRQRLADAEFVALNPAGFLPAIEDDGVSMVDSIAILEYIIVRYGGGRFAPAPNDPSFPTYQQFLHLGESGLAAYLNIVVACRFLAPEGEKQNWGTRAAEQMFFNRLTLVSRQLARASMMAGNEFTAADISVIYALGMAERLGLAERFGPEIADYRNRMSARPAYKVAMEKWSPARVA
ncbi:MAG TPA: glutathione S-transferase family protein [Rhizomicrobium sp.]|jgi:glutathione S-transferase|nr:glutathione S-transferase family protein [Rhizomicrobium sp.]